MRMRVAPCTRGLSEQQEIHALTLSRGTLRCSSPQCSEERTHGFLPPAKGAGPKQRISVNASGQKGT